MANAFFFYESEPKPGDWEIEVYIKETLEQAIWKFIYHWEEKYTKPFVFVLDNRTSKVTKFSVGVGFKLEEVERERPSYA